MSWNPRTWPWRRTYDNPPVRYVRAHKLKSALIVGALVGVGTVGYLAYNQWGRPTQTATKKQAPIVESLEQERKGADYTPKVNRVPENQAGKTAEQLAAEEAAAKTAADAAAEKQAADAAAAKQAADAAAAKQQFPPVAITPPGTTGQVKTEVIGQTPEQKEAAEKAAAAERAAAENAAKQKQQVPPPAAPPAAPKTYDIKGRALRFAEVPCGKAGNCTVAPGTLEYKIGGQEGKHILKSDGTNYKITFKSDDDSVTLPRGYFALNRGDGAVLKAYASTSQELADIINNRKPMTITGKQYKEMIKEQQNKNLVLIVNDTCENEGLVGGSYRAAISFGVDQDAPDYKWSYDVAKAAPCATPVESAQGGTPVIEAAPAAPIVAAVAEPAPAVEAAPVVEAVKPEASPVVTAQTGTASTVTSSYFFPQRYRIINSFTATATTSDALTNALKGMKIYQGNYGQLSSTQDQNQSVVVQGNVLGDAYKIQPGTVSTQIYRFPSRSPGVVTEGSTVTITKPAIARPKILPNPNVLNDGAQYNIRIN